MTIPETLLDIRTHTDAGFRPLVDYDAWRVAILNYSHDLRSENIDAMQRHRRGVRAAAGPVHPVCG